MYLLGIAGSGKSTIIEKIISKFYDSDDVKMLSNNIEKKFGLKPLANAKIVAGSEIQGDCALEQTEWQLIAEGGTITPAEKNKNAETITWMPPVPMAGNSVPEYNNQCGQQSRRMVIWKFWRKVVDTNTNLEEELADEIPKIIKMGVMGYHWAVNKYQKRVSGRFYLSTFKKTRKKWMKTVILFSIFLKLIRLFYLRRFMYPRRYSNRHLMSIVRKTIFRSRSLMLTFTLYLFRIIILLSQKDQERDTLQTQIITCSVPSSLVLILLMLIIKKMMHLRFQSKLFGWNIDNLINVILKCLKLDTFHLKIL